YFDSDNLISNESSYLHVLGELRELGVQGGAYIGVGPDQNFSYIAHVRPTVAYIIDIRRDNLLQHLFFKALFAESRTRLEYLALLTARPLPDGQELRAFEARGIDDLVARIDGGAMTEERFRSGSERIIDRVRSFGVPLSDDDLDTIRAIHRAFADAGLDLRFRSHGRAPRPYYPTFRRLLIETDRDGNQSSFLAGEASFRFVKQLEAANRVIPVVGDLAGEHALRAIGRDIAARGEQLSAFYTSNVEFYLMADRTFARYIDNVRSLPSDDRSVIIRSYFSRGYPHPESLPGHYSTQLVQTVESMVAEYDSGGFRGYFDLVNGG
ncbi:MAG: hypothetical protein ACRELX_10670, partial [Longimicrobiales bacterium]